MFTGKGQSASVFMSHDFDEEVTNEEVRSLKVICPTMVRTKYFIQLSNIHLTTLCIYLQLVISDNKISIHQDSTWHCVIRNPNGLTHLQPRHLFGKMDVPF